MWASKLSTVTLRWHIERNSASRLSWSFKSSLAIAFVWGPVCLALMALQCQLPAWRHMEETTCERGGRMQVVVVALNMASDVWLSLAPIPLIMALQIPMGRRIRTIVLLALRLLCARLPYPFRRRLLILDQRTRACYRPGGGNSEDTAQPRPQLGTSRPMHLGDVGGLCISPVLHHPADAEILERPAVGRREHSQHDRD